MDLSVIVGLVVGIGGILVGNALEDGHLSALIQGAAFVIVFLGTAGATILSNKSSDLKKSVELLFGLFAASDEKNTKEIRDEILECARIARKENVLALEQRTKSINDPFLRDAIAAICDNSTPELVEEVFLDRIEQEESKLLAAAKVWTDAGGYAPTIGIIGAVLGLIHVMGNITDTSKLGSGIGVAFVATIYGVGIANLILLPIGSRLKRVVQDKMRVKHMVLSGAIGIQKGLSPGLIQVKLNSFQDI